MAMSHDNMYDELKQELEVARQDAAEKTNRVRELEAAIQRNLVHDPIAVSLDVLPKVVPKIREQRKTEKQKQNLGMLLQSCNTISRLIADQGIQEPVPPQRRFGKKADADANAEAAANAAKDENAEEQLDLGMELTSIMASHSDEIGVGIRLDRCLNNQQSIKAEISALDVGHLKGQREEIRLKEELEILLAPKVKKKKKK